MVPPVVASIAVGKADLGLAEEYDDQMTMIGDMQQSGPPPQPRGLISGNRRVLVYLHGLNSSSRSHKAAMITEALAPLGVRAPDYPAHRPREAVASLAAYFAGLPADARPLVVGSSMGGFYGQWLARRFVFSHLFLINPALTPWTLFPDYVGQVMTTAHGEQYRVSAEMIESTRAFGVDDPCDGVPTTVLLDRGDEVIDWRIAESLYRRCGRLVVWDGGDHAFQHMDAAIELIRREAAAGG
jgi:uncharacterized protein